MALDNLRKDVAYGFTQGLLGIPSAPIVSSRNPTVRDKAQIGQQWVNRTTGITFFLSRIVANVYTWYAAAQAAASYTAAGAIVAGTTLTVGTTATIGTGLTVTAGGLTVAAGGAGITGGVLASTSVQAGTFMAAGTTITAGTNIVSTLGNITATAGNIVATLGNVNVTAGNINMTLGDINMVNGNLVFTAATTGVELPGPVTITTGAGVPANGLAVNVGDMYIRTDAAAINTRIYIATAAGAWTACVTLA